MAVFTHIPCAALAIIEILLRHPVDRSTGNVTDADPGIEKDLAASLGHPFVILRIFIVREGFVIATDLTIHGDVETGMMSMIDIAGDRAATMGRPARTERRIHDPAFARSKHVSPTASIGMTTDAAPVA